MVDCRVVGDGEEFIDLTGLLCHLIFYINNFAIFNFQNPHILQRVYYVQGCVNLPHVQRTLYKHVYSTDGSTSPRNLVLFNCLLDRLTIIF